MALFGMSAGTFEKIGTNLYRINLKKGFSEARFATDTDKLLFEVFYYVLTPLGSIPTDPDAGTLIPNMIGRVALNSSVSAQNMMVNELNRAEAGIKLRQQQNPDLPATQRLGRLEAERIEVNTPEQAIDMVLAITDGTGKRVGFTITTGLGG
jgi:hypothetical protein